MASQGNPARLEILTTAETSAFDRVANVDTVFSRLSPGTTSGHGSRRCQARVSSSRSASESPTMPHSSRTGSSASRYTECTETQPRWRLCAAASADALRRRTDGRMKIRRRTLHVEQQRLNHNPHHAAELGNTTGRDILLVNICDRKTLVSISTAR